MHHTPVSRLHISVFWTWVATSIFIVIVYLFKGNRASIDPSDALGYASKLLGLVIPQVTMMATFIFRIPQDRQLDLIEKDPHLARLAVQLSVTYHVIFWILLIVGV